MIDDQYEDYDESYISKSEQKRQVQQYREIAEKLISLNKNQLQGMSISPTLLEAITTGQKLKVGNALRRQLSYISKLIQKDNNEEVIENTFQEMEQHDFNHLKITKNSELWRERLLSEEGNAIGEFIEKYSSVSRQQLNQYVRNAQKEQQNSTEQNKRSKHYKQLFTFIRSTIENSE